MRAGKRKPVRTCPGRWELYDMEADRTEPSDLAEREPERVERPLARHSARAERCGVIPQEKIPRLMAERGATALWEDA